MGFFSYFGTVILVSAFWSLLITTTLNFMPDADRNVIISFEEAEGIQTDFDATTREFQSSLQSQKNFGIVDLAALALYSGNIVIDLAANFFFAIPQMFSLLFFGIFSLLRVNDYIQVEFLIWIKGLLAIVATMILIQFLLGVRSQSLGAV